MSELCPMCSKPGLLRCKENYSCQCEACGYQFSSAKQVNTKRVFISYDHDEHISLAVKLRDDLIKQGHEVWFDKDRLKPGSDWESYIEEGLYWATETPLNSVSCC